MYSNPLEILKGFYENLVDLSDPNQLLRIKKIILSKFELSSDINIEINESQYSKNDILQVFTQLASSESINYYALCLENEALHNFLSKRGYNPLLQVDELEYDANFYDFISPFLIDSLRYFTFKVYTKEEDINQLQSLYNLTILNTPKLVYLKNDVFFDLITVVNEKMESIYDDLMNDKIYLPLHYIKPVISKEWTAFFNNLDTDFETFVDLYASHAINIGSQYYNGYRKETARYIYKAIKNLNCTKENRATLKDNYKIIVGPFNISLIDGDSFKLVLLAIFIIIKIAQCNKSTHVNTIQFNENNFNNKTNHTAYDSNWLGNYGEIIKNEKIINIDSVKIKNN